jgi:cytochrome c biogenesis protein CcdA
VSRKVGTGEMLFRLGSALILIGLIVLVVFALTLSVGQADLRALLTGAGLAILGLLIHRRARKRRERTGRFRTARRIMGESPPDDGSAE